MSTPETRESWTYAEEFVAEPEAADAARRRGIEFGSATLVGTGAGALLRVLAASVGARHVMEIGSGGGTSGILAARRHARGRRAHDDRHRPGARQRRQGLVCRGRYRPQRTRVITGRAAEVLPG